MQSTSLSWPRLPTSFPVSGFHSRTRLSAPQEASILPSGENARQLGNGWQNRRVPSRMMTLSGSGSPCRSVRTGFPSFGLVGSAELAHVVNAATAAEVVRRASTTEGRVRMGIPRSASDGHQSMIVPGATLAYQTASHLPAQAEVRQWFQAYPVCRGGRQAKDDPARQG